MRDLKPITASSQNTKELEDFKNKAKALFAELKKAKDLLEDPINIEKADHFSFFVNVGWNRAILGKYECPPSREIKKEEEIKNKYKKH
jgi:hypothetical protein